MPCVYFIRKGNRDVFKVGMSGSTAESRLKSLQTGSEEPLSICGKIFCNSPFAATELEHYLHRELAAKRLNGEWFGLSWNDVHGVLRYYEQKGYKTEHATSTIDIDTRFVVNRRGQAKDETDIMMRRALARIKTLERANAELTGSRLQRFRDEVERELDKRDEEIDRLRMELAKQPKWVKWIVKWLDRFNHK